MGVDRSIPDKPERSKNELEFRLKFGSSGQRTLLFQISSNIWYHIVGTYDGSEMKLFVDGDLNKIYGCEYGYEGEKITHMTKW